MAELVFIATTIFFAYVMFIVLDDKNKPANTSKGSDAAHHEEKSAAEPQVTPTKSGKAPSKTEKTEQAAAQPASASNESTPADSIKNPKTGEIAKVPGNYAFAKRWIKEALVEEGLLEKIYKNNELDNDVSEKIQKALQDLRAMEKYR